jgi:hypothetical protein
MYTTNQASNRNNRHRVYKRLKKKVHLLLDPTDGGTIWDQVVNSLIVSSILLNVVAVCLETVEGLYRGVPIMV